MADIFREVDEEVRQDQVQSLLVRYWPVLLVAGLLIVGGAGGWRAYTFWRTQQAEQSGARYLEALRLSHDGKSGEAVAELEDLGKTGTPGYRLLSRFRLASELAQTKPAEGAQAFDALAADGAVDPALQDIARLRAGALLADTLDLKALQGRLEPLADANSSLRNPARELLALAALKVNDNATAGRYLDAIVADRSASAGARQRAEAFLSLVRSATPSKP